MAPARPWLRQWTQDRRTILYPSNIDDYNVELSCIYSSQQA
jgi:hypothetical protein